MKREFHIVVGYNSTKASYSDVQREVMLATAQWPSVTVHVEPTHGTIRFISKWQTNVESCVEIFRHYVRRHIWWEEVE